MPSAKAFQDIPQMFYLAAHLSTPNTNALRCSDVPVTTTLELLEKGSYLAGEPELRELRKYGSYIVKVGIPSLVKDIWSGSAGGAST